MGTPTPDVDPDPAAGAELRLSRFDDFQSLRALRSDEDSLVIGFDSEWYGDDTRKMLSWQFALIHGKLLVETPHDFSFPSGHTIASFEASVALYKHNKRLGIPALILACLIAFSRMYLYVHYPTDVIASVILGSFFAVLGYRIVNAVEAKIASCQRKAA